MLDEVRLLTGQNLIGVGPETIPFLTLITASISPRQMPTLEAQRVVTGVQGIGLTDRCWPIHRGTSESVHSVQLVLPPDLAVALSIQRTRPL